MTTTWELQRIIYCLAIDEEALMRVKGYTQTKSSPMVLKEARRFSKSNAEALLGSLRNQSIQQNLASALASTRQVLLPSAGTSSSTQCPIFRFADITYYPNGWGEKKTYELTDEVASWCEKNSEEPTQSFLRLSHQWNSLTSNSDDHTVASYFPNPVPPSDEEYVLVSQKRHMEPSFCIYVIPGHSDSTGQLRGILRDAAKQDVLYNYPQIKDVSNNWRDIYKKWLTTDSGTCQEIQ